VTWEGLNPPYATIVADPPWSYVGSTYNGRSVPWRSTTTRTYSLLSIEEIAALPVADLATRDAHLYLWAVNPLIHRAFEVIEAWGFIHDTVLTWCKPGPGLGAGFRSNTEHLIVARKGTRGNASCSTCGGRRRGARKCQCSEPAWHSEMGSIPPLRPFKAVSDGSWFTVSRGAHSEKPRLFLDLIERMSPGPYVELFARAPRLGWDSWGKGYEIGATA
jgi:N6-adenosine-specific RNA methylase IME4